jgi:hypothetical protein
MTERQRQILAWIVLFLFVLLAGHLAGSLASPVIGWLMTVATEVFTAAGLPRIALTIVLTILGIILVVIKSGMLGFAYCLLFDEPWRKSGAIAWALTFGMNALGLLWKAPSYFGALALTPAYGLDAAVSLAACLGGAWLAHENRHNDRLGEARDMLFRMLRIG